MLNLNLSAAGLSIGALLAVFLAAPGTAQSVVGIRANGGVAIPTSSLGDQYSIGYSIGGGLFFHPNRGRIGVRADVDYSRFKGKHPDFEGSVQTLLSFMGNVTCSLKSGGAYDPYVVGGVGVLGEVTLSDALIERGRFAFQGGFGISYGTGKSRFFSEARYLSGSKEGFTSAFLPVVAGASYRFRLGK